MSSFYLPPSSYLPPSGTLPVPPDTPALAAYLRDYTQYVSPRLPHGNQPHLDPQRCAYMLYTQRMLTMAKTAYERLLKCEVFATEGYSLLSVASELDQLSRYHRELIATYER